MQTTRFLLAAGGLCLAACATPSLYAQQTPASLPGESHAGSLLQDIRFKHITEADGLPENSVLAMIQDRLGFVWLGTRNGVVRYDGVEMRVFQYEPENPFSLRGSTIGALLEDRDGDVWVGAWPGGLFRYERATGRFHGFDLDGDTGHTVNFIHQDSRGAVWYRVAGEEGLRRIDPGASAPRIFRYDPERSNTIGAGTVSRQGEFVHVDSFYEDRRGTIWIGTYGGTNAVGLNRYNRETDDFTRFVHDPGDPTSLPLAVVGAPFEDSAGRFWVPTWLSGLSLMDREAGTFTHFRHAPENPASLPDDRVYWVYEDSAHVLWVGTLGGLCLFDPDRATCRVWRHIPDDPTTPGPGLPVPMHETPDGDLIFAHDFGGLSVYSRDLGQFRRYRRTDDSASLSSDWVSSLLVDRNGSIWVGTNNFGLNKQDRALRLRAKAHNPLDENSPGGAYIHVLHVPKSRPDVLWIGHDQGLDRLDRSSGRYRHFRHDPRDPTSIPAGIVFDVVDDPSGRTWITTARGLSLLDPSSDRFIHFVHDPSDATSLLPGRYDDIMVARDGTLWISSYGAGISRFHPDSVDLSTDIRFTHTGLADTAYHPEFFAALDTMPMGPLAAISAPGNMIEIEEYFFLPERMAVLVAGLGEMTSQGPQDYGWIERADGTIVWEMHWESSRYGGGNRRNRMQADIVELPADDYRLHWISDPYYHYGSWTHAPPASPDRWGIEVFPLRTADVPVMRRLTERWASNGLPNLRVWGTFEDNQGTVWIGTDDGGLSSLDPETGRLEHFYDELIGPRSPFAAFEDQKGRLWAGDYYTGLHLFDRERGSVDRFTTADGLPSNSVYGLTVDDEGYLWGGSTNGLFRLDPDSREVRRFGISDGLPGHVLAVWGRSPAGEILAGGQGGFVTFFPDQIVFDERPPEIMLTGFEVFGRTAAVGRRGPLPVDISLARTIALAHDENDFTIHFAADDYSRPEANRYVYRLDPYDSDWVEASGRPSARYTNVSPGEYVFRVRAANPDGFWNEHERELMITVLPPWWRTIWAYAGYVLFLLGAAFSGLRWQHRRVVRQELEKSRERELEQARKIETAYRDLEQAHSDLKVTQQQLVQSEKMASLGQLASGIAHEMQNPLNFVNNFAGLSAELIEEINEEYRSNPDIRVADVQETITGLKVHAEQIRKHGERAGRIVKSMMAHAETRAGERYEVGLNDFVDEYLARSLNVVQARYPELDVSVHRDFDPAVGNLRIGPPELGRALVNIVTNALETVAERERREDASKSLAPAGREETSEPYSATVRLSTRRLDDRVEIRVSDNGPGVPENIKDRIFEPFFTTKPAGTGTGLGLSLAYEIIVDGHGGTLTVDSDGGDGATFVISLPADPG